MSVNELFDSRRSDRRLFAAVAIFFPIIVLIGFARTYYLKLAFGTPPLPSMLVHVHGLLMTLWVGFFILQVWLIRSRNANLHIKVGIFGIALASAMILVGFFTAVAAAKYGSPSTPPVLPLAFLAVPIFDIVLFAVLFGAAIYYRRRPANHKRLMLLTVLALLSPALARIPIKTIQSTGPIFFFGVPSVLAIGSIAYDTWQNRRLNVVFLAGAIILIASYPMRLMLSSTKAWLSFAAWLTTWAA